MTEVFGEVEFIESDECAFITKAESEKATDAAIDAIGAPVLSKIRFL